MISKLKPRSPGRERRRRSTFEAARLRVPSKDKAMQLEKGNRRSSSHLPRRSTLESMDSIPSKQSESTHPSRSRSALSNSFRRSQQRKEDRHVRTRESSVAPRRRHMEDTSAPPAATREGGKGRTESTTRPKDPVGTSRCRSSSVRPCLNSNNTESRRNRDISRSSRAPSADSHISTYTSSNVNTKLSHSSRRAPSRSRLSSVPTASMSGKKKSSTSGSGSGSDTVDEYASSLSSSNAAISKLKGFRKSFGLSKRTT